MTESKGSLSRRWRRIAVALVLVLAVIIVLCYIAGELPLGEKGRGLPLSEGQVRLTVLMSGQSDCLLLEDGESSVLIDAGGFDSWPVIDNYLDFRGVERPDIVVLTHPHSDHYGSLDELLRERGAGRLLVCELPEELTPTNSSYQRLQQAIEETGTPTYTAGAGEVIELPNGRLRVLSSGGYGNLNDCSIVLRYEYGGFTCLLMGDAERAVERDLVASGQKLECLILKIGHHGSNDAGCAEFLEAADPDYIAVTSEFGNEYNLPGDAFLKRVEKLTDARLLRTDRDGHIVFTGDRAGIISVTFEETDDIQH